MYLIFIGSSKGLTTQMKDNSLLSLALMSIFVAIISAALGLVVAFPVMWLWNAFIPAIFGLKTITWFQALCLYVLCSILFKSHSSSSSSK